MSLEVQANNCQRKDSVIHPQIWMMWIFTVSVVIVKAKPNSRYHITWYKWRTTRFPQEGVDVIVMDMASMDFLHGHGESSPVAPHVWAHMACGDGQTLAARLEDKMSISRLPSSSSSLSSLSSTSSSQWFFQELPSPLLKCLNQSQSERQNAQRSFFSGRDDMSLRNRGHRRRLMMRKHIVFSFVVTCCQQK